MVRRIAISAAMVSLGLALVWLGLPTTSPSASVPSEVEVPRRLRAPAPTMLIEDLGVADPPTPVPNPARVALHQRALRVIEERIEVVVPDDASPSEAFDLQMDVIDLRSTELDELVVDLTELAETTADASTRTEALVSLAEVYVELAEVTQSTPIPGWVRPRRAARLEAEFADQAAISLDQAQMVLGFAEAGALDADQRERIDALLEVLE